MSDEYASIAAHCNVQLKVEGSKFISDAFPITSEDDVISFLEGIKKKYFDATHHCFAFVIGKKQTSFRYSDDGEPSGTAGIKIFSAIQSHNFSDTLVVVTRYFGGTKLGVGGLGRAYYDAAQLVLQHAKPITKQCVVRLRISFFHEEMNGVMNTITKNKIIIAKREYTDIVAFLLYVPKSFVEQLSLQLTNATRGQLTIELQHEETIITD